MAARQTRSVFCRTNAEGGRWCPETQVQMGARTTNIGALSLNNPTEQKQRNQGRSADS